MRKLGRYLATGMIVLGSVMLASKAEAVVYEFTNFNPGGGPVSASGFFDINDANSDGFVDFSTELTDFNIVVSAAGYNSVQVENLHDSTLSGVSVTPTTVSFTTANDGRLCFSTRSSCSAGGGTDSGLMSITMSPRREFLLISNDDPDLGNSVSQRFGQPLLLATAAPTAVPFDVSPTIGILALGGIWGVSRLRKSIAAHKLNK